MHIIILEFLRLVTPKKLFSSPCRLVSSIHELKHHHGYRGITLNRILLPTCGRWGNKPFQLSAPSGCLIWATFPHNHPLLSVQHSVTNRWGYRSPGCFDLKVLLDLDSSSMFLLPCPVSNKQLCCEMCFKMLRNKLWKRTEYKIQRKTMLVTHTWSLAFCTCFCVGNYRGILLMLHSIIVVKWHI